MGAVPSRVLIVGMLSSLHIVVGAAGVASCQPSILGVSSQNSSVTIQGWNCAQVFPQSLGSSQNSSGSGNWSSLSAPPHGSSELDESELISDLDPPDLDG